MMTDSKPPRVRALYRAPLSGPEIEARSFECIEAEVGGHAQFDDGQWEIVRRMIHTTGDPGIAGHVRFSPDAVASGIRALRRAASIYVDASMIAAGLSIARLKQVCPAWSRERIFCHVADDEVAGQARQGGLPRGLYALRKARKVLDFGIVAIGNSPVALLELNRLVVEEGVRPGLVVGMPVGFVHVVESKTELMSLDVPWIVVEGRRGGSPLAVAVIHALAILAGAERSDRES